MVVATSWSFGEVMWSMLIFFTWILFFWMLFAVLARHLPAARHQRLGEGRLDHLHGLPAVPRDLRLPDLEQQRHGRTQHEAGAGCAGQHRRVHQVGGEQRRPGSDDREGARTAGEGRNHAGRVRAAEGRRPGRRLRTDAGGAATAAPPGRRLQLGCSRRADARRPADEVGHQALTLTAPLASLFRRPVELGEMGEARRKFPRRPASTERQTSVSNPRGMYEERSTRSERARPAPGRGSRCRGGGGGCRDSRRRGTRARAGTPLAGPTGGTGATGSTGGDRAGRSRSVIGTMAGAAA